ncbi:MAG: hypothetical protein WDO15_22575 [Bacteroidota bacterium]
MFQEFCRRMAYVTLDNGESGTGFLFTNKDKVFFICPKHLLFTEKNYVRSQVAQLSCIATEKETTVFATIHLNDLMDGDLIQSINFDICSLQLGELQSSKSQILNPVSDAVRLTDKSVFPHFISDIETSFSPTWDQTDDIFLASVAEHKNDNLKPMLIKGRVYELDKENFRLKISHDYINHKTGGPAFQVLRVGDSDKYFRIVLIGLTLHTIPVLNLHDRSAQNKAYSMILPIDVLPDLLDNYF